MDLLVRLYDLPPLEPALARLAPAGITLRRALVLDRAALTGWVAARFAAWVPEVEASLTRLPPTCVLAQRDQAVLGFACWDAIAPNLFGPTGVADDMRGQGVGRALLLWALHAQRAQGYAYAVIGGAGPVDYYARAVGAVPIAGSEPGLYAGRLRAGG